jgi:hypothetical protein
MTILAIIATAFISSVVSIHYTAKYKDGEYAQKILETERKANETLQKEKDRANQTERNLIAIRDKLEVENAKNEKRIKELLSKYNAVVNAGGRLRDPGTRPSCQNTSSSDSTATTNTAGGAGAELSEEASRFLLSEAARADTIVEQLNLCKAWAIEVKTTLEKYQEKP